MHPIATLAALDGGPANNTINMWTSDNMAWSDPNNPSANNGSTSAANALYSLQTVTKNYP